MIRKLEPKDRAALNNILNRTSNFKKEDVDVALELIDIAINNPLQQDYNVFVLEDNDKILGYHCTGRRPITDAVYDLYWIVTDPSEIGKGIGKKLLEHAQEFVINLDGRWLLAETSSKEAYKTTRSFYENNGFRIVSQIDHFYSLGESLIIFGKYFWNNN